MNKKEVVKLALEHEHPPYVPWSFSFTLEAMEKLKNRFGAENVEAALDNHLHFIEGV